MLTGRRPAAIPVLDFAAEPHGAPPAVLRAGATGDYARRPVGGDPMLVLRRSADVVRSLADGTHFAMAGVTGTGGLRGSPLTGAEMQSPDGGLLNMNAPGLLTYRRRISHLFTRRAAEATRPAIHALAAQLAASLAGRPAADVLAGFAEPFTAAAVCSAMGVPASDWSQVLEFSRVAFAVVPGPAAVSDVIAAWEALYEYYGSLVAVKGAWPDGTLTSRIASALDGATASQVTHVIGTVSNGFGAVLPVLAVALAEVAQRPQIVTACLRGERTWMSVAEQLLRLRTIFPVALPRVVLADTQLAGAGQPGHGSPALTDSRCPRPDRAGAVQYRIRGRGPLLPGGRADPALAGGCASRILRGLPQGQAGRPAGVAAGYARGPWRDRPDAALGGP